MLGNRSLAAVLAAVMLSGPWTQRSLESRMRKAFGARSQVRAKRIVNEVLSRVSTPYPPQLRQLERLVALCPSIEGIGDATAERLFALKVTVPPARFAPVGPLEKTAARPIATQGDLAEWLRIPLRQLAWLTDERRTLRRESAGRLQHYDCVWAPKRDGRWRLIEAPKARMKEVQRRILREILDHAPPHEAAFAFRNGKTCAEAAAKHASEVVVVTVDLKDSFLTVRAARVHAIFRSLGYPAPVARLLTALCTTSTPRAVLEQRPDSWRMDQIEQQIYRGPHLPQGAPTSPALANLAARRLDCRLAGLSRRFEARYTRYADDLTFSGDSRFQGELKRFLCAISSIVVDEGFTLNASKTRIMPRSGRQVVTGLVVNDHINVPRRSYDALKALLTNCERSDPVLQNREGHADFRAHLDGRIAWVEAVNLRRGEKLRRIFDAINW